MPAETVDAYLAQIPVPWQQEVCRRLVADLRSIADFQEDIKWGHPYFAIGGAAVVKWYCASDWINVYFFRGRELDDPGSLFEPSSNRRMLLIRLREDADLDAAELRRLIRQAVQLARGMRIDGA